jgi:Protein of unknown function, DUF481
MKQYFALILISLSWAQSTFAQLNESDTLKFQLRVSVTGNYQQGNVELLNVRNKVDFVVKLSKDVVFKSQNISLYQSFYNVKADNDFFSRNYLYYTPNNKVYPFAISYISSNYRRKVDYRHFVGAGATWRAINNKKIILKLSASAVYESTKFDGTTYNFSEFDGREKINVWRGTLYAGGGANLLDNHFRIYYNAYWQPAFENSNDYRAEFDIGLDFPIWKGFSFNTHYNYTHEQIVVNKIKQKDKLLSFGMAYNYKIR